MRHTKPHRTTAIKTKSRIIVEDFQSNIQTISIKGSTGFNPTGRSQDRGVAKIKEMKSYLESVAEKGGNGDTGEQDMYFHNFTNNESYAVHLAPEGVTFSQSVNSPLTHNYEINLIVLRKASEPKDDEVMDPEIGNKLPSVGGPPLPGSEFPNAKDDWGEAIDPGDNLDGSRPNTNIRTNEVRGAVNSQTPSVFSYEHGQTELGYLIGYYGREVQR